MDVFEIAGYLTGVSKAGVNYLQPSDSFQEIRNGFIFRQVLQSRLGFVQFGNRLLDEKRVMGIFEHYLRNNTTELLICSKDHLYKFNTVTNQFDQIPDASAVPFGTFGIVNNEDYVSGTTYPFADGSDRFVFTGKGMSDVYFYDGTNVKRYTNVVDNPDYQAFAGGALTNAHHVKWFGERLNFFYPTIAAQPNPQAILYSGIRDTSGNGDKFNTPGSGLLAADTPEFMTGVKILGDKIIMNFSRSNWSLEKTRDAFNPYFIRKIPSVLGTESDFSAVSYGDRVEAMGQTGLITTDDRLSTRIDNKIPFFCQDSINTDDIQLIYGGFDRTFSQFLFSYLDNELDSGTQSNVLVHNYEEESWSIYDQRFSVFGQTLLGLELSWDQIDETINPAWEMWDNTEDIWNKIGQTSTLQKTLAGDDLGFIYQLSVDFDDYFFAITNITSASSAVVTIGAHAFQVGDNVIINNVIGLQDVDGNSLVNGISAFITAIAATTITVNIDTTDPAFNAYISGGNVSKVINFEATMQPFNPYRDKGFGCNLKYVDFLIDTGGGFLRVDFFSDEEETPWKANVLLQTDTTQKARQYIRVSVNHDADFHTIKFSQNTVSEQVKITSIRLYCEQGERTYA